MNILYLYTEVMGYNLPIFEQLANEHGATVHVVRWTNNKLTPFVPKVTERVKYYDRSSFSPQALLDFASDLKPAVAYISGWQDKGYLPVARLLKSQGTPVVTGLDSQWFGTLRQKIGALLVCHWYKKRYFSYAWVPGPMQYEYAARIGFLKTEIISNLLSGNAALFSQAAAALSADKLTHYPKQFLYVGRFAEAKGIDILIEAYSLYQTRYRGAWTLKCIGNGPMEADLLQAQKIAPSISVEPFADQLILVARAANAGAFILPSRYEPWGVVAHEFACAGLPMLLSDQVGSKSQFLIEDYNGYGFRGGSAEQLALAMHRLSSQSDETLIQMGQRSAQLASVVTPQLATASLMSVVNASAPDAPSARNSQPLRSDT
jgi:glycosyltransferase involved in cell wall biosynthesis